MSVISCLRLPVHGERAARAGVITAVLCIGEGGHVVEAGHSVIASLEHLWVGAELHGPVASPVHSHSPQINQLGTHGTAHGMCKQFRRQIFRYIQLLSHTSTGINTHSH